MDLESLLEQERKKYIEIQSFVRQIGGQHLVRRGLPVVPSQAEADSDIKACRDYFEMYGTTKGPLSPWIESYNDEGHL